MTTKKLTCCQVHWAEKLSKYNFKIMYQTEIKNVKTDTLTHKLKDKSTDLKDECCKYQHQVLLTSNWLKIQMLESDSEASVHNRILFANQEDEKCTAF